MLLPTLLCLLALVTGCSDATGPTEEVVRTPAPVAFMYRDVNGGGGGGGGGNAPSACNVHSRSWQCLLAAGGVVVATGAVLGGCGAAIAAPSPATGWMCGGTVVGFGGAADHFANEPNCPETWCQIPSYPTIGPDHSRATNFGEN